MTKTDEKVEELKIKIQGADADEVMKLDRMNYRLSDAIREGASVTDQATGSWGNGEKACALHAGLIAAKARGYIS